MKRFVHRCWGPFVFTLLLNHLSWQHVTAKKGGGGGFLSEYQKNKQYKKIAKAAVPIVTIIGSLGWAAHQQHHPPPSRIPPPLPPPPPPTPKTVIIHVPKPVPIPVPVPVYHYNIERHHHHKQKPKFVYLKNKKRSRRKKGPKGVPVFYSIPFESHVTLDLPSSSRKEAMHGAQTEWSDDELQPAFSSPTALVSPAESLDVAEGHHIIGIANSHSVSSPASTALLDESIRRGSSRRTARLYGDYHYDDMYR